MTRRVPDEAKRLRGTLRKDRVTHAATDRDPVIPERPDWLRFGLPGERGRQLKAALSAWRS